jgi:hypothetical protein
MRVGHPAISVTSVMIQGQITGQILINRPYFFYTIFYNIRYDQNINYCIVAKLTEPENRFDSVNQNIKNFLHLQQQ